MRIAVIGAGVVGLAATAALLERRVEVQCYERAAAPMGERSAGDSRIFRAAHLRPELVQIALAANAGFRRWEKEVGAGIVNRSGCVISGARLDQWRSAMMEAGASHEIASGSSGRVRLPLAAAPGRVLIDPLGGVIDVDMVRAYLVRRCESALVHGAVDSLLIHESDVTVSVGAESSVFDFAVIAAGRGNSALAAQVDIDVPAELSHHVRFSFPVAPGMWQCWIDEPMSELSTYQHASGPGTWAVGGYVDPTLTAWEVGRAAAIDASRDVIMDYVRKKLTVQPKIVDSLYCTITPDLGAGIHIGRNGPVLAVFGEGLFKFAPVLGDMIAAQLDM